MCVCIARGSNGRGCAAAAGREAALTAGGKNLRFTNDTSHYIWVAGTSDGTTTQFCIWGSDDGREVEITVGDFYDTRPITKTTVTDPRMKTGRTLVRQNGQSGRSLKVTRVVTRDGKVLHNDVFESVWPMVPQITAVGSGK